MWSFHSIEYCLTLKRNDADPEMIKYQQFHKIQVFFYNKCKENSNLGSNTLILNLTWYTLQMVITAM